jgi:hypothetical protein
MSDERPGPFYHLPFERPGYLTALHGRIHPQGDCLATMTEDELEDAFPGWEPARRRTRRQLRRNQLRPK